MFLWPLSREEHIKKNNMEWGTRFSARVDHQTSWSVWEERWTAFGSGAKSHQPINTPVCCHILTFNLTLGFIPFHFIPCVWKNPTKVKHSQTISHSSWLRNKSAKPQCVPLFHSHLPARTIIWQVVSSPLKKNETQFWILFPMHGTFEVFWWGDPQIIRIFSWDFPL